MIFRMIRIANRPRSLHERLVGRRPITVISSATPGDAEAQAPPDDDVEAGAEDVARDRENSDTDNAPRC